MNRREDNAKTISPELMARIEALEDEGLRANVLMCLSGPGRREISNEQIFENMVATNERVLLQRALRWNWRDDEILGFVEFFKGRAFEDFSEFERQHFEINEISDDIWWRGERLAERFLPGLSSFDYSCLMGLVRRRFWSRRHCSVRN